MKITLDVFYVRALSQVPKPWFTDVPIGRNTSNNMVKRMCKDAKVDGEKSNHNLVLLVCFGEEYLRK